MSRRRLSSFKNQNFKMLKDECLKSETLFVDKYFPFDVDNVEWLRPGDICEDPRFYVGGASRFDVLQGQMGDCWLIVAMSNLIRNQTLFQQVVPRGQSFLDDYAGIFHFRIWQCGDWVEVVIDDRLPTRNGELIYIHSKQNNEFWSALLEKAYAKIYGSYGQLSAGGWFCEGMVDFTGGVVESVSLVPPPLNLDNILLRSYEKGSFMCVFMRPDTEIKEKQSSQGLVHGHAYSINKVQNVNPMNSSEKLMLVRLRNPWGHVEWTGAWSDLSPEWTSISDAERNKLGLVSEDDGEFWMSVSDLITHFLAIDICHLSPTLFKDVGSNTNLCWEEHCFKGQWIKDLNAGGRSLETIHINPQFKITLTDADDDDDDLCTLIVALMQKNKTRNIWHRIGFTSFKIDDPERFPGALSKEYILDKLLSNASSTSFKHTREIVLRSKWEPGVYCILPSTYSPNHEGQFLLRVYSEKNSLMEEPDDISYAPQKGAQGPSLNNPPEETAQSTIKGPFDLERLVYKSNQEVESFFYRIAGKEKEIGWQGLQSLLQFAMSPNLGLFTRSSDSRDVKFPKYECRTLIAMLDVNHSGKLDFDEFQALWGKMRLWESIFLRCSRNTEFITAPELKQALVAAGFHVPSNTIGSLVKRHSDDQGKFSFNDFVMCAVELQTS